jgi:hypothetical protein
MLDAKEVDRRLVPGCKGERTNHRSLNATQPADDHDEDHPHGPVEPECRIGLDSQKFM